MVERLLTTTSWLLSPPRIGGVKVFPYPCGVLLVFAALILIERLSQRRQPLGDAVDQAARMGKNLGIGLVYRLVVTPWIVHPLLLLAASRVGLWERAERGFGLALLVDVALLDLANYVSHVVAHRVPFVWRFHAVHHSDQHLDATTAFRVHPGERLMTLPVRLMAIVLLAIPLSHVAAYEGLALLVSILHHTNMRLPAKVERLACAVFTMPTFHHVHHHSRLPYTDSNFGGILSLWDRLFGTFSTDDLGERLTPGIEECVGGSTPQASLVQMLAPLRDGLPGGRSSP